MNKEEFILNIRPANGEPSKEYVMRLNTKLLLENEQLQQKVNQLETNIDEAIEFVKSKNNGVCIKNGIEKNAYTFLLDFDEAREFVWELEEILERR